jgi:hypothetical protein
MSETLNNANKGLTDMVSSTGEGFTNAAANVGLGPAATSPISPISNPLANPISSGPPPLTSSTGNAAGFKDFMESNNLVAKIAFLLLVIFVFIILLQLCIKLLVFFFDTSSSPYLINGMVRANQPISFPQDPSSLNAKPLQRSINGPDGIEFTWSIWIYIETLPEHSIATNYLHIFNKGNSDVETIDSNIGTGACVYGADSYPDCVKAGLVQPNNAPGLYIAPGTNELVVKMNTFDNINNEILIPNIPLNKWINVIIRCQNTTLDIYINGTIAKSIDLGYVPKQNYGDVYTSLGGGFDGYISNLRYYNYALGTSAIQSITQIGPNIKTVDNSPGSGMASKYSKYFSLNWYFAGNSNQSGGFY